MSKLKNLIEQKFGKLRVLKYLNQQGHNSLWLCRCDCGKTTKVQGSNLQSGHSTSCGCFHNTITGNINRRHGMAKTRFYVIWKDMKQRVINKNTKRYKDYGGRGINICQRWQKFENFRDDMYKAYLEHVDKFGVKQTSIDRIDNDGNYEFSNCRWATIKEQVQNRRIF